MAFTEKFAKASLRVPELVIPNTRLDLTKYAVLASDQKSADYWDDVKEYIGKEPSTMYFVMPEAWYGEGFKANSEEHQQHEDLLAANMKFFLVNGSLEELDAGAMYVKRVLKNGKLRKGLLMAFDLESFDLVKGKAEVCEAQLKKQAAIRAKLPLECPSIILGYEDKDGKLNKYLDSAIENEKPYYDFDLMKESGHLTGCYIKEEGKLEDLSDILLEINGDGNAFSLIAGGSDLAAAKANWDRFKRYIPSDQRLEHPARFTLVELVNSNDETLPITDAEDSRFSFDSRRITKINKEHIVPNAGWNI